MGSNGNKSIRWYTRKYPKHDHTCDYTITNWNYYLRSCLSWLNNPIYYNPTYIISIIQISINIYITTTNFSHGIVILLSYQILTRTMGSSSHPHGHLWWLNARHAGRWRCSNCPWPWQPCLRPRCLLKATRKSNLVFVCFCCWDVREPFLSNKAHKDGSEGEKTSCVSTDNKDNDHQLNVISNTTTISASKKTSLKQHCGIGSKAPQ